MPNNNTTPNTAPQAVARIIPFLSSLKATPIISQASKIVWIMIIPPAIEVGKPNPITRPNDNAKLVANNVFLSV